jgi:hypothetical protein
LKIKYPFGRQIEEKNGKRIFIKLISVKKGVPKANSQIYLASPEDLAKIAENPDYTINEKIDYTGN